MRVGVIDDDEGMRDSLGALLQAHGLEVCLFGSVEDALAEGDKLFALSALIVDQHLPGLSGLDLIRRVADHDIATVLISAQLDNKLKAEALKAGARAALGKPLDAGLLLAAVNSGRYA
ncbi:MAG TPA: response regulator [Rhodospirillaceae bacterium]|nr:response regulator [Rhodospirillaceae bacterium]